MRISKKTFLISALVAAAALLFAAYSYLPLAAPAQSASPDENANLFFSQKFAADGSLWHYSFLEFFAPGLVHPRSMRVVDDFIVPGGFIGLPVLYGGIARIAGAAVLPFVTPIFAILAVAVWGLLIAHFFGRRVGAAAAVLLAFHPVWWYETARTMQPNVLFCALVIFGAYFLFAAPFARAHAAGRGHRSFEFLDGALAGMFAGLALAVRPSEGYWIAGAGIACVAVLRSRIQWKRLLVALIASVVTLTPFLFINASVYGTPWVTGYGAVSSAAPLAELPQGGGARLIGPLQPFLFPLGFAPRSALQHFADFGVGITWWWSVLVLCALSALAYEWRRMKRAGASPSRETGVFAAGALTLTVWLVLFYGSWTIRDNPDPDAVTIGSSYLRYWLPIYIVSTVPVAWLASRATSVFKGARANAALAVFLLLAAAAGATDAFWSPQEGLVHVRAALIDSDSKARKIFEATPDNAIIVTDRADKYLFPKRAVIVPLRDEATYQALGKVRGKANLFYFGITFPDHDLDWLRSTKLPPLGLDIKPVLTLGEETLYRFEPLP